MWFTSFKRGGRTLKSGQVSVSEQLLKKSRILASHSCTTVKVVSFCDDIRSWFKVNILNTKVHTEWPVTTLFWHSHYCLLAAGIIATVNEVRLYVYLFNFYKLGLFSQVRKGT